MEVHGVQQQEKRSHKFIIYAVSLSVAGTPNASIGPLHDPVTWYKITDSCFEKGCPTNPYATMPKGIMVNWSVWSLIET